MKISQNLKLAIIFLASIFAFNAYAAKSTDPIPSVCSNYSSVQEVDKCMTIFFVLSSREIVFSDNVMSDKGIQAAKTTLANYNQDNLKYFKDRFILISKVQNMYSKYASEDAIFEYLASITSKSKEFYKDSDKSMDTNSARYLILLNNEVLKKSNGGEYIFSDKQLTLTAENIETSQKYLDSLQLTNQDASMLMYFTNNVFQYSSQVYQLDTSKFSTDKGNIKTLLKVYSKEEISMYSADVARTLLQGVIDASKNGSRNKAVATAQKQNAEFYYNDLQRLIAKK
jgi:hypothetical protein